MPNAANANKKLLSKRTSSGFRVWLAFLRAALDGASPVADLAIRILLAQRLVVLAVMVGMAHSHPVAEQSMMMSEAAVAASGGIGGLLLGLGAFTRIAAASLALSLVARTGVAPPAAGDLFDLLILGWYLLRGPGTLSVDRAVAIGVRASALPLSGPVMRGLDFLRGQVAPRYLAAVRVLTGLAVAGGLGLGLNLPDFPAGGAPQAGSWLLGASLILGLALPVTLPIAILAVAGAMALGDVHAQSFAWLLVLTLLLIERGGRPAADGVLSRWLHAHLLYDRPHDQVPEHWPHVVIVGAGFGGLACADRLRSLPVRVTVVDKHNYHLFQPLLYQIATAGLSPADIASPVRGMFAKSGNVTVRLASVTGVDAVRKRLSLGSDVIAYDYLVLATGSAHSYFGRDEWAAFAPGLKRIEDGVAARNTVLGAFERAEALSDPAEVSRMLTFVVIGGGPTGVELAGAIAELARTGLNDHYRAIDPAKATVVLIHAGDRILPSFREPLSRLAEKSLIQLGVEVRTGARVTDIDADGVMVGEERIRAGSVLWAAGVMASPAGRWLDAEQDPAGRVVVTEDLSIPNQPDVFAIGDTASSMAWNGEPVPGLAPAAKQGGVYVASVIRARIEGREAPPPFRYRHMGSLATIGRKSAVADFGFAQFSGATAWWLWGAVHIAFLVGVRNRLSVMINWLGRYLSYRPSVQLITGSDAPSADAI